MDLVELLSNELKDKHFTEFQKARYIYIRCCEIFSFDARWNYFTLFPEKMIKEIEQHYFNIHHIQDTLVVCHSFSQSILHPLLQELTSLDVECKMGEHSLVQLYNRGDVWELDGTLGDQARAKMGLITEGFRMKEKLFPMKDFDLELGFQYTDKKKYAIYEWESGYDFMNKVGNIIQSSKCKYHYSDVVFLYNYMTYLMRQDSKTMLDKDNHLYRLIHFNENDEYYTISKIQNEYCLELVKRV